VALLRWSLDSILFEADRGIAADQSAAVSIVRPARLLFEIFPTAALSSSGITKMQS